MSINEYEPVLASFQLDKLADNRFQSRSPELSWKRIYGGLLLAHAVRAGDETTAPEKELHALHANFLRPGQINQPLDISVEPLLSGKTISHRRITINQSGKTAFIANLSYRRSGAKGLDHAPPIPQLVQPENLAGEQELAETFADNLSENTLRYLKRQKAFEIRPVDGRAFLLGGNGGGNQPAVWVRPRTDHTPPRKYDAALLAYLSDMMVLNASLGPHGRNYFDQQLTMASLDHGLWMHVAPDWSDWLLITHEGLASEAGMGLGQTRIFNRSGSLCATIAQQGFIRPAGNLSD